MYIVYIQENLTKKIKKQVFLVDNLKSIFFIVYFFLFIEILNICRRNVERFRQKKIVQILHILNCTKKTVFIKNRKFKFGTRG